MIRRFLVSSDISISTLWGFSLLLNKNLQGEFEVLCLGVSFLSRNAQRVYMGDEARKALSVVRASTAEFERLPRLLLGVFHGAKSKCRRIDFGTNGNVRIIFGQHEAANKEDSRASIEPEQEGGRPGLVGGVNEEGLTAVFGVGGNDELCARLL